MTMLETDRVIPAPSSDKQRDEYVKRVNGFLSQARNAWSVYAGIDNPNRNEALELTTSTLLILTQYTHAIELYEQAQNE